VVPEHTHVHPAGLARLIASVRRGSVSLPASEVQDRVMKIRVRIMQILEVPRRAAARPPPATRPASR
jgi:hypothetical protein